MATTICVALSERSYDIQIGHGTLAVCAEFIGQRRKCSHAVVISDANVLTTLPDREYRSGLAEVVKYGVIFDEAFLGYLEQHVAELNARQAQALEYVVAHSCRLKARVVEQDEREETGVRAALNYGHTFAHAIETVTGYGRYLHGEAVAIGMIAASRLAESLDRAEAALTVRQRDLL